MVLGCFGVEVERLRGELVEAAEHAEAACIRAAALSTEGAELLSQNACTEKALQVPPGLSSRFRPTTSSRVSPVSFLVWPSCACPSFASHATFVRTPRSTHPRINRPGLPLSIWKFTSVYALCAQAARQEVHQLREALLEAKATTIGQAISLALL